MTVKLVSSKLSQTVAVNYDPAKFREEYGFDPIHLIDLKALMGDASDNIPGVPGVGEKTALDLMHRFGSLDALYADLDGAELRDSLRQKLAAGKDSAYLSRTLGTICRTAPVDVNLEIYRLQPYRREELAKMLTKLEFFKLLDKWGLNASAAEEEGEQAAPPPQSSTILEGEAAMAAVDQAAKAGRLDLLPVFDEGSLTGIWAATPPPWYPKPA